MWRIRISVHYLVSNFDFTVHVTLRKIDVFVKNFGVGIRGRHTTAETFSSFSPHEKNPWQKMNFFRPNRLLRE